MYLEIIDTVYVIAYLRPSDPLHSEALEIFKGLGSTRKVSQAALIELDLIMKSRGFTANERMRTWELLDKIIPRDGIEPLTPKDFEIASILTEQLGLDYFDALVAAQCIVRKAKPITTDKEILEAISRYEKAYRYQQKR